VDIVEIESSLHPVSFPLRALFPREHPSGPPVKWGATWRCDIKINLEEIVRKPCEEYEERQNGVEMS
jgi:hypothetical protein